VERILSVKGWRLPQGAELRLRQPRYHGILRTVYCPYKSLEAPMERPERASFSTLDFQAWQEMSILVLTPKFQRRAVWKTPARSYFIDSLLEDIPVPPIFLRMTQSKDKRRTIREVIDGQQRLRAVLEYLEDKYALSRSAVKKNGGRRFSELDPDSQDKIRNYSFPCETFYSISDPEVLEIFARVNTYSVKLNAQELRNGQFFGFFKRSAYSLAHEHLEFWRQNNIFSEGSIARMLEVELTSELMVAQLAGQQDKKKSLEKFYADYDEKFDQRDKIEIQFRTTIDTLSESVGDILPEIDFHRPPLFYTLFCVAYHRLFGMPQVKVATPQKGRLPKKDLASLRDAASHLSDKIISAKQGYEVAKNDLAFVNACLRQTDNIKPREIRLTRLYKEAFTDS
jgi:hypothetical protein